MELSQSSTLLQGAGDYPCLPTKPVIPH